MIVQITRKTARWILLLICLILAGSAYWVFFIHGAEGIEVFRQGDAMEEKVSEEEESDDSTEDLIDAEDSMISEQAEEALLAVHVSGAVHNPDHVFYLPQGSRLEDAVLEAGGALEEADLSRLNLASLIYDGEKIYVPIEGETDVTLIEVPDDGNIVSDSGGVEAHSLTNLNTATTIELEALPGIGEAYAQRIIQYREENGPFQTIEEIKNVKGIGDAIFAKIRALITV